MKILYKEALEAYTDMLLLHIDTKATDVVFHKETEEFYESLFEVAHKIGEKYVDLGGKLTETSLDDKKNEAHKIISNLRKKIEDYKEKNKITLGTEDLLGALANDLEFIEGTSRGFLKG